MIKIEVDEAYAFDMLAIALVKLEEIANDTEYFDKLYDNIRSEVGADLFHKVYLSNEFDDLYNANRKVFDYVEILNNGFTNITALEVHLANMDRFKYKKELQNKFFGTKLLEQKTA